MRPANPKASSLRTRTRFIRSQAAAHLGWAHGWPESCTSNGLTWRMADTREDVLVNRELLHRATHTHSTLVDKEPRLVDRALPEGRIWRARVPELMDLLKPAVHQGQPLPADTLASGAWSTRQRSRITTALDDYPFVDACIRRATWTWFLRPKRLLAHLDALETLAPHLAELEVLTPHPGVWPLRAWQLCERLPVSTVAEALELLVEIHTYDVAPSGQAVRLAIQTLQKVEGALSRTVKRGEIRWPERFDPTLAAEVEAWCDTWLTRPPAVLERTLNWWLIAWPRAELRQRHRWLAEVRHLRRQTQRMLFAPARSRDPVGLPEVERLRNAPARLDLAVPLEAIASMETQDPRLIKQVVRILDQAHRLPGCGPNLFSDVTAITQVGQRPLLTLRTLAERLESTRGGATLQPWLVGSHPLFHIMDIPTAEGQERAYDILARLAARGVSCEPTLVGTVSRAAPCPGDLDATVDMVQAVHEAGHRWERGMFKIASVALGALTAAELVDLDLQPCHEGVVALLESGRLDIRRVLLDPPTRQHLRRAAELLQALPVAKRSLPLARHPDVEWDAWPPTLRPLLERLARVHPHPRRRARALLRQRFRPRSELHAELAWLEQHHPDDLMERKRRIRASLDQSPSARTLGWMQRRLELSVQQAILTQLEEQLRQRWQTHIHDTLDLDPEALPGDRRTGLLLGLGELSPAFRRLAAAALRLEPLYDRPANAQWITAATDAGLDLQPWLEPDSPIEVMAPDGTTLLLALERDPVETLWMGSYFGTCLSVDEFNFFSAVANTVDANKAVLYARDEQGAVVARCLFAISRQMHLLTFHAYGRSEALEFGMIASAFATDLARAMGTHVAPKGEVANLLAPDWYDDGTRDLADIPSALAEGGPLHTLLLQGEPADIDRSLRKQFGARSHATLVPMLAATGLLRARPALYDHWRGVIAALPIQQAAGMVAELHHLDRTEQATSLLMAGMRTLQGTPVRPADLPVAFVDAALDLAPASTMRWLRRAAGHHEFRFDHDIAYWVGRGLEAMHRRSAAREQYRAALQGHLQGAVLKDARARLRELTA